MSVRADPELVAVTPSNHDRILLCCAAAYFSRQKGTIVRSANPFNKPSSGAYTSMYLLMFSLVIMCALLRCFRFCPVVFRNGFVPWWRSLMLCASSALPCSLRQRMVSDGLKGLGDDVLRTVEWGRAPNIPQAPGHFRGKTPLLVGALFVLPCSCQLLRWGQTCTRAYPSPHQAFAG